VNNIHRNLSEMEALMQTDRHPLYGETEITCTCGITHQTRSTTPHLRVVICSNCHPFYTGRQRVVGTAERVEAFQRKYGKERHTS
jgi:large subunit ribosomal protein L31